MNYLMCVCVYVHIHVYHFLQVHVSISAHLFILGNGLAGSAGKFIHNFDRCWLIILQKAGPVRTPTISV